MKANIRLLETDQQIKNLILNALSEDLDIAISKSLPNIKQKFIEIVTAAIKNQPEYISLKNGQLRYEFGIANVSDVDMVIDMVVAKIQITTNPISNNSFGIKGGLKVIVLAQNDIQDAIRSEYASVTDSKGYSIPWLEWLLLQGNARLVKNFEVKLGTNTRSRSGNAIMIKSTTDWSVPSIFAGTVSNNWFTRALSSIDDNIIQNIMQQQIEKNI